MNILPEISKVAHQRRRFNKPDLPRFSYQEFVFWDIETTTKEVNGKKKIVFDIAVLKHVKIYGNGFVEYLEYMRVNSEKELWNNISRLINENKRITFVAHNTAFDIRYSHLMDYLTREQWYVSLYYETMSTFMLNLKKDKQRVLFIDSMNWYNMSLEKLGKHVGIEKQTENMFSTDRKIRFEYCGNDVDIMIEAFARYKKWLWDSFNLNMKLTRGGDALNCFRTCLHDIDVKRPSDKMILRKELSSYYGGRTEAFKIGNLSNYTWYKYDINSLYPFVMANADYPVSLASSNYNPKWNETLPLLKNYIGLGYVECDIEYPAIPVRTSTGHVYPVGKVSGYYCGKELEWLLLHGSNINLDELHLYSKAPIFKEVITKLNRFKELASKQNNEVDRTNVKLIMNSIYGKFAQRNEEIIGVKEVEWNNPDTVYKVKDMGGLEVKSRIWQGKEYTVESNILSQYSFPLISSVVTSNARMYLWDFIVKCGIQNVAYVDTDSIITNLSGSKVLDGYRHSHEMGKWKFEGSTKNFIIHGLKDYLFGDQEVVKGVPKRAKKLGNNKYSYERIGSLRETGLGTKEPSADIVEIVKVLNRQYEKSVLCETCGYHAWHGINKGNSVILKDLKDL